jgi:hypothetical protein
MHNPRDQLPVEAVRDLLGICRALYRAWYQTRPATEHQLGELRAIGQDLKAAIELATRCEPDTVGHRAAWGKAERAMKRLGTLITEHDRIKPPIVALFAKVLGERR